MEAAKRRIIDRTREDGRFDTVVEVTKEETDAGSVALTFQINKGEEVTIEEARYHGSEVFDPSELESVTANREREFMGWMIGRNDGELKLPELEMDNARIKDLYLQNGYLDAEVSDPLLMVDFDRYKAKLYFQITEGLPYVVTGVDVQLQESGDMNFTEVREGFLLTAGETFDVNQLRKDMTAIQDFVGSQGYAFARVYPDIQKNETTHEARVVYNVTLGQKVYIRDVIISGNTRTLDRVVRREVYLAPGDLYNLVDIKESRMALNRLGYFETVELQEKRVSESQMDLIVKVKEGPTGNLMIGGGYGSYDGVMYSASVSDRNIFGTGIDFSIQVERSAVSERNQLSFTNPRLNDGPYSVSLSFYDTSYEGYNYDRQSRGVSLGTGRRLGRHWNLSTSLSYSRNKNNYSDDYNLTQYSYFRDGTTEKIALGPVMTFNDTDDYFFPTQGLIFRQSLERAGFGGDEEYTKAYTRFSAFYSFKDRYDLDIILRYKGRLGIAEADINNLDAFPLSSRFYLGGVTSLRGFQSNSIAPYLYNDDGSLYIDPNDNDPVLLGGNRFYSQSLEASFPLVPAARMRFAFFYDYGTIGLDSFTDEERKSYGFGIEWFSPMGPLLFVWGWPVDYEEHDRTANFEFTIGQPF